MYEKSKPGNDNGNPVNLVQKIVSICLKMLPLGRLHPHRMAGFYLSLLRLSRWKGVYLFFFNVPDQQVENITRRFL